MNRKFKSDFLALFETHIAGSKVDEICHAIRFSNFDRVEVRGQSGGIWLLWHSNSCDLQVVSKDEQFIHAIVNDGLEIVHIFVVYGCPLAQRREGSGGLSTNTVDFNDWVHQEQLNDMGYFGTLIQKRLDRGFLNLAGLLKWPEAVMNHLPRFSSYHNPLLLSFLGRSRGNQCRRPFRFQVAWLTHPMFKDMNIDLPSALRHLKEYLNCWNKETFGNIHSRKEALL
ncbi:hypothetical protein V2J09_005826 [Rumex salicifolius]